MYVLNIEFKLSRLSVGKHNHAEADINILVSCKGGLAVARVVVLGLEDNIGRRQIRHAVWVKSMSFRLLVHPDNPFKSIVNSSLSRD